LREKSLAALRAKIHTIIAPAENEKDLDEIPRHIRRRLTFKFVQHMDEVLKIALKEDPESKVPAKHSVRSTTSGKTQSRKKSEPATRIATRPVSRRRTRTSKAEKEA
jgi:ATP-dependent Lon protease